MKKEFILAAALILALGVFAGEKEKLSWLRISENGIFTAENVTGRIVVIKPGYKISASENELNAHFLEQLSTIELDSKRIAVRFTPFKDWKPIRLEKKITIHGSDAANWHFRLQSPDAHPIADLGYTFGLPAETFAGKELLIDGVPLRLPARYSKLHLKSGNVKSVTIPLEHGKLTISGEFKLKIQDMRKWNAGFFNIYFHIPFYPPFREAEFEFDLNYTGLKLSVQEFEKKKPRFTLIPLDRAANASTVDDAPEDGRGGWTDQGGGNDLRSFDQTGEVLLKGIPYRITDRLKNGDRNCLIAAGSNWKQYPRKFTVPLNGRKAGGLYFLHTSAWTPAELGKYTVRYTDGSSVEIPLRNLKEISNWWTPGESDCSVIAWRGRNPSLPIGIGTFAWSNPHPERAMDAVEGAVSPDHPQAVMMLLGLTLADGFPYLQSEKMTPAGNIDDSDWIEVSGIDETSAAGTVLDVSDLVPAPAGKFGFTKVDGEDFIFENGRKIRFIGMNIEAEHCFPTREQAEFHAKRLRRLGVNAIRFHKFDMLTRARRLILDPESESGEFSRENQDRFEYFIAKLKENGIYLVMDLQTIRVIGAEECPPLARERYNSYGMFVPELIEAQKRFITRLLTHRNPYTGLTLAEDPALALIIFHNENSMLYQPNRNRITSPYALKILKDRFNGYLQRKYKNRNALADAWETLAANEDPANGSVELPMNPSGKKYSLHRLADMRLFYYEIQKAYYREIRTHLKNLGVRVPMTGSNHWTRDPLDFELNAQLDYTDRHNYWSHPTASGSWLLENILFAPSPMIQSPDGGIIGTLAGRRILGKPFAVTEWNDGSTNEYRADAQILVPAYASLHNWSIFQFTYSTRQKDGTFLRPITYSFGIDDDPLQLALYPVITRMFLRGDILSASGEYAHFITGKQLKDPAYYLDPADARQAAFYTKSGLRFGDGKTDRSRLPNPALEAVSETGELFWNNKTGQARINTPHTQGFVGFPEVSKTIVLRDTAFRLQTDFAAVVLISCDGKPVSSSRHLLLAAVARAWNKGMKYNSLRNRIVKAGTLPVVMQPVKGSVELSGNAKGYRVSRLDISGRKIGDCPVEIRNGKTVFQLNHALYYELKALPDR